ncbi:MAG: hypothetical protein A3K03_07960 [Bdellovibrionales bacterium RIFOXYD1_FULL_44_7]|nr:MAG: hypothetical protein A3K03_07960 [Bdellovibrionales bacterium RIFOXYD1_FULL_44_7]
MYDFSLEIDGINHGYADRQNRIIVGIMIDKTDIIGAFKNRGIRFGGIGDGFALFVGTTAT